MKRGGDLFLGFLFDEGAESLATPFELWCEQQGVRPGTPGALQAFEAASARLDRESQRIAG